jgi:hypothetical protein
VNQGGEPGHDDDGLPRVDIEIPDDARELYRDVQAYHRELRALRRRQRSDRLRAPLRRTGIALPLMAGFLLLALVSGIVLTVFSTDPYFSGSSSPARKNPARAGHAVSASPAQHNGSTGTTGSSSAAPPQARSRTSSGRGTAGPTQAAAPLPGKSISVAGKPVALRTLTSTALAIVPANCGCAAAVRQLLEQARLAKVTIYLVGPRGSAAELARLAAHATPGQALVATDAANVLQSAYRTAGLTVLLVDSHGVVMIASGLRPGLHLERELDLLRPAG